MSELRDDEDLRTRFLELRGARAEPGATPDFQAMLDRARAEAAAGAPLRVLDGGAAAADRASRSSRSRKRLVLLGAWVSTAAAAAAAAVLLTDRSSPGEDEFVQLVAAYSGDVSGGAWVSPTSGLLEVPGIELVRSVPSVGGALGSVGPAPSAGSAVPRESL